MACNGEGKKKKKCKRTEILVDGGQRRRMARPWHFEGLCGHESKREALNAVNFGAAHHARAMFLEPRTPALLACCVPTRDREVAVAPIVSLYLFVYKLMTFC
jgi:hypothetical protein